MTVEQGLPAGSPVFHPMMRTQAWRTSSAETGHGTDVSYGAARESDIQS
jgi:hypothetical protein